MKKSLRLAAYSRDPTPRAEGGVAELFSCATLCAYSCDPRKLATKKQARRNCALPGFDQRAWDSSALRPAWMGLPEQPAILRCRPSDHPGCKVTERAAVKRPLEDIENEGCPGAWYRTPFFDSVARYKRRSTEGGGRVANPRLDRCDDDVVLEAVALLEAFEDAWECEHLVAIRKKNEKE